MSTKVRSGCPREGGKGVESMEVLQESPIFFPKNWVVGTQVCSLYLDFSLHAITCSLHVITSQYLVKTVCLK